MVQEFLFVKVRGNGVVMLEGRMVSVLDDGGGLAREKSDPKPYTLNPKP